VPVRKVVIQVVAGRNIAVLVEAAVRNTILQLRGIDTYQEFVERHRARWKWVTPPRRLRRLPLLAARRSRFRSGR
jgi:serine kinase of HPr protein (carbohydrate metabolism regulator)